MKAPRRWNGAALAMALCAVSAGAVSGCGEADGQSGSASGDVSAVCPPAPELKARQVGNVLIASWSLPSAPDGCGPLRLLVTAHSKTVQSPAIPAQGGMLNVTAKHGSVTIALRDFDEPPFSVNASTFSSAGRSKTVDVDVTGGPKVTPEQQEAVRARIEACRPVATAPKTCPRTFGASEASGRVKDLSPSQLASAIRKDLRATFGTYQKVTRLVCNPSGTCDARFTIDHRRYLLAMRYHVRALPSAAGKCWVVTSWQVVRPGPFANVVLPVPDHGCVYA